jgi:DegV family protein with EDD domain
LEQIYREAAKDGSEIVALHLSSALSGTYQSAVIASNSVKGVYVPDVKNATIGLGLIVRIAVKLRDEGRTAREISERIAEISERVRLYAYVDSLRYLVRGGRVSAAAGIVGGVLDIHPIISVIGGAVVNVGKAKGKKAACKELLRLAKKDTIDKQYGVMYGHSADAASLAEFKEYTESFVGGSETHDNIIGGVIGTHVGPGAIGLAFIASSVSTR